MKLEIKKLFSWIILENIFTTITSFFIFFYLATFLDPAQFGTVAFFTAIIMISYRFSDFGFENQFMKEDENLIKKKFPIFFYFRKN